MKIVDGYNSMSLVTSDGHTMAAVVFIKNQTRPGYRAKPTIPPYQNSSVKTLQGLSLLLEEAAQELANRNA